MSLDPISLLIDVSLDDGGNPNMSAKLIDVWLPLASKTRLTAVIADEQGKPPSVFRYVECGCLSLERRLLDQVVLLCFERIQRERLVAGDHVDRTRIVGANRWLERQMLLKDAVTVITECRHQLERAAAGLPTWRFISRKK